MKLNKILLTVVLIISCAGMRSYGKAVDENTAKTTGSNFLITARVPGLTDASGLSLVYTATAIVNGSPITDFYVFNITGGKGFVMVSGDDNVIPILAYSGESSFDFNKISPSTKDWINGYQNQITAVVANNVPAKAGTAERWNDLETGATQMAAKMKITSTTSVAALVSTTWDQDGGGSIPYNDLCPNTSLTGGESVTGCVATAMSQVMKFWNWPTVGCGSHTYTDPTSGATLTADFGNTAYDWSAMPLTSSNIDVATLMFHAGVSVNMSYSADESGSYVGMMETEGINCAEYALKTYFHYKPGLKCVLRFGFEGASLGQYIEGQDYEYYNGSINMDSIAQASWISMLQAELNAGRPMLYEGQGTEGGHCWVCDGWETTSNMFHFNWGWSGESDGYYTVDALSPPALGTGAGAGNFNYDQGVVMGIQPDSFASDPGNMEMLAHLNTTANSPMDYGTPFSITTKIKNTGSASFNGSFCLQSYDTSNNMLATIATRSGESVAAGDSSAVLTFTCSPYALIPNIYNGVRLLYQPAGATTWTPVANNGSFINYTIIGVLNDSDIVLYDSLHVGSHSILPGSAMTITTTIGNQGTSNFSGTLQAVLVNTNTGAAFTVQSHASETINSYGSHNYTFTNSDISLTPGLYALEIEYQYNSTGDFYTTSSDYFMNPILITVIGSSSTEVANVTNANDVYVYPNPASNVINVLMQGTGFTAIRMMDMAGRTVKTIVPANQLFVAIPVTDLAPGIYFVQVQTATGLVTKKVLVGQ